MSTVRHFLDAIKFEHTVFALPFAYVAMFLAADGWPGWPIVLWVTLAMVGARTLAMSVNRLADRFIDAANPRTARRHLPIGLLTATQVTVAAALSAALLLLSDEAVVERLRIRLDEVDHPEMTWVPVVLGDQPHAAVPSDPPPDIVPPSPTSVSG